MRLKTNMKLLEYLKIIFFIILFAWISFFSPLIGEQMQVQFLCILSVLLLILAFTEKYYKNIFSKTEIPFWIFMLTMLGGIIIVKDPFIAYKHFQLFILPIPFLYYFAKIGFENKYAVPIIRSICLMASLVCIYGIIEFVTKHNFIYEYLIHNQYYRVFVGRRMISTHIHPAPLGTYLVAIFPLSIALLSKEKKLFLKFTSIIYAVVIFIGIILTFSRGVLLGFFVAMFLMAGFLNRQKKMLYMSALISLSVIIIGISSLLFYCGHSFFVRYSLQGLSIPYTYYGKIDRLMTIGPILTEQPFFGLGFGHYRVLFDYYLPHLATTYSYDGKVADCMYLTILTETGIVGFSGFILFIYFLFKRIRIRLKILSKNEGRIFLVSFLSGFIGILCSFLTYDGLYWTAPSYLFWSYAGILSFLSTPD